ncbi:PilX N-terminal domain-containing pilus assembly protein [Shewanella chilikensis]|uniref:PilX N-terminal domain-containing pilus assembly protein n=1 Tax=Shewanella chilikensis TaxID=558541 RepID=UPI00300434C4
MRQQRGVVLFFALIILIILTLIGVALAVNSSQSLRMAGAGAERVEAKALADGGLQAVLNAKSQAELATMTTVDDDNSFLGGSQVLTPLPLKNDGTVDAKNVACQRSRDASGTDLIKCRRVEVSSQVQYGRDNLGQLTVIEGVEQEVLNGSGS